MGVRIGGKLDDGLSVPHRTIGTQPELNVRFGETTMRVDRSGLQRFELAE